MAAAFAARTARSERRRSRHRRRRHRPPHPPLPTLEVAATPAGRGEGAARVSKLRGEVLKWRGEAGGTRGEAGGTKREAGGCARCEARDDEADATRIATAGTAGACCRCLGVTRHAPSRSRSTDPLQSRAPRRRRSRLTRLRRPRVGRWAHERARGWAWWAHMDGAGGRRAGSASHRRPQAASTARRTGRAAAADVGRSGGWVGPLCAREGGRGAGCAHLGLDLGLIAPSREHEDVSHHRGATPLPEGCCLRATSLRRVDPRTIPATNGGAAAHGRLAGAVARRGAMCPPWRGGLRCCTRTAPSPL